MSEHTWVYELRRVSTGVVVQRVVLPAGHGFIASERHPDQATSGWLQWWVDRGQGFEKYGVEYRHYSLD